MELYPSSELKPHDSAAQPTAHVGAYLDRLTLSPTQRDAIDRTLAHEPQADATAAITALHRQLASDAAPDSNMPPAYASVEARLTAPPHDTSDTRPPTGIERDAEGRPHLRTMPPIHRTSMVPEAWPPHVVIAGARRLWQRLLGRPVEKRESDAPTPRWRWNLAGKTRRYILLLLVILQTTYATYGMSVVLPYSGTKPLEMGVMAFFAILFAWVSAGFWTALMGFWTLLLRGDRFLVSRMANHNAPIPPEARTAIIMPIANEDVARVIAGLRATYASVARTGELDRFDFFILSDSGNPDIRTAEMAAWRTLCQELDAFGRIFYRWRKIRVKRKTGNVSDFCRRWGAQYRYMVVLDADSVMSGECLTTMVRMMEGAPNAGIIQTAPYAFGRETLYARVQQFATRVYGPLYTAGLHFWQLGESHYWGHNAIIRVAPFIKHCALAPLPGKGPLAGEILSHDFVEAAMMRRAGWSVWIAYDLRGSYEELPPNLLDELKRDRRWCQGNLMNFRLWLKQGFHAVHRFVFLTGVMAYLSAPLWFLFLLISTLLLAEHTLVAPEYFSQPYQLFPNWPEWHPEKALALFTVTATLLFLPKILSVAVIMAHGARRFGGNLRLVGSMLIEVVISALLAPTRMLFHSAFVTAAFSGWGISWKSPPREDAETTWGEAIRRHGLYTLLGLGWGVLVWWLNPAYLLWLLPIVGALVVSIPLSVFLSRVSLGRRLRAARLFLIPEEARPPRELREMQRHLRRAPPLPGFIDAVVDPYVNALACATGTARPRQRAALRFQKSRLVQIAQRNGPRALDNVQRNLLLSDPLALSQLHLAVWSQPDTHEDWGIPVATLQSAPVEPAAG